MKKNNIFFMMGVVLLLGCTGVDSQNNDASTDNVIVTMPQEIDTADIMLYDCDYLNQEFPGNKANQFFPQNKLYGKSLYLNYGLKGEMPLVTNSLPGYAELLINHFNENLSIEFEAIENAGHVPKGSIEKGLHFVYKNKLEKWNTWVWN